MNLKEIFIILYHNNIGESIEHLRELIKELTIRNKKFIICSHSTIPQDIIDKSEAYIYDSNNFIFDSGQRYFYWINLGGSVLYSPYLYYGSISHKNYSLAAIKNILNGVSISYQLGYDVVHSVEYDCIPNFDDLHDNLIQMDIYDSVVYKDDNTEMNGHVFTIKTNKNLDLRWDEEKWKSLIMDQNCFSEKFLFELIKNWTNNILIKQKNKQTDSKVSSVVSLQTVLFEENNNIKIFIINSSNNKIEDILIYYNGGKISTDIYSQNWKILDLGSKENNYFVDVFIGDKLNRKWDISNEELYNKYVSVNKIEIKNE